MTTHIPRLKTTALQSRDAIELLADRWRIVILHLLRHGVLRTHQLQSAIEQISPKMLTQTLRGMERDGLVNRTMHPVAPPHVEYELTKMGRNVIKPIQTLCHWAKAHVAERDAARERFDTALTSTRSRAHPQSSK
jgi:DNA-binding HxlR family transcriptional regulator